MDRSLRLQKMTNDRAKFSCGDAACNNAPGVYLTRDMLTDPPTIIHIVLSHHSVACLSEPGQYYINMDDIEPTAGWLGDRSRSSLDICFMFSFGKCSGKTRDKHPATCHQIHVKRSVLDTLRSTYVFHQRRYFCRTMKANITEKVSQQLWNLARKRFSLQYLEFKTEDIDVTAGSTAYEVEYRNWLTSDDIRPAIKDEKCPQTDNYFSCTNLCWEYAVTGRCPKGASCMDIHGHLVNSLSKHRYVKMALKEINKTEELQCSENVGVTTVPQSCAAVSHPEMVPKIFATGPQLYAAQPYFNVAGPSPYVFPSNGVEIMSSFQPTASPNPVRPHTYYVLVEGPDKVLRVVPLN